MTFWHFYCLGYYQSSRFQAVIRLPRRNGVQDVQLPHLSASAIGTSGDYYNSTWHERWPADSSAQGWITVIQCRTAHRLRPTRSSSESKINWLASCYNSRECLMLVHCSDHFIGCRSVKESSLKSQLCYIRYALLLIQRICTRCCRTTSVNPQRHGSRHLGRFYTYHELELSTAVAVAAPTLWNSLPADIRLTNTALLTAFRNRLKAFLFHRTPSGFSAD